MFIQSLIKIYSTKSDMIGSMSFNKDDDLIIDFVSAATNIRAFNFSIPMEVIFILFVMMSSRVSLRSKRWQVRSSQLFHLQMHW